VSARCSPDPTETEAAASTTRAKPLMAGRNTAVSGIYRLKNQAERALDMLIAGGIPCSSISVLLLDPADVETGGAISNNRTTAGASCHGAACTGRWCRWMWAGEPICTTAGEVAFPHGD
jgi:hypothetical protein